MPDEELSGILNINKPTGMTSHDVVARVRRLTGQKKVGHAGTLDPMAQGVLLLCLGQATRVAEYLMDGDKVYEALVRLGVSTDTYDAEGKVTSESPVNATRTQVEEVLSDFVGTIQQTPPVYSAIKHEGTPLYRLARRGQPVSPQPRPVEIHALTLQEWSPPDLRIEVQCGKGTYIRSLAHDVGQRLGCGAHLAGLTRTASGHFRLEGAITLASLAEAFARGDGPALLQPLDVALQHLPMVTVETVTERAVAYGQRIQLPDAPQAAVCRAYAQDGRLLALLRRQPDGWQPHKVFVQPVNNESHP